ncbi:DNA-processing protein DprA [Gulosibacter chungangensis]|uniref:DNA-protecting protein DprA n=1 Tax=Gulosibacter chungangensis TaxID=979746 RepID=A0A7J5B9Y8_9MICO|nr:DNA-processing protein DprA [Gulosibacter chungangensis]KAB1642656.1 DNA-protecting protein DprA [Gulosibacter chungangensis]
MVITPQFMLSQAITRQLDAERLQSLLGPIVDRSHLADASRLLGVFGRITWNTVVEPGDGDAGLLTSVLGQESCFALADGQLEVVRDSLAALGESEIDLAKAAARWSPRLDLDRVVMLCRQAANLGLRFISPEDSLWPSQLDDLGPHAPQGLWVRGNVDALRETHRSLALVGARASTNYGDRVAGDLAAELAMRGLTIISGGAYGIDAAAHRAALASGGSTIAILAGGADRLYPSGNRQLLERISAEGAIITEAPVGQPPTRWRFLQRNRLIAALTQASIVVEAGARSGALNTANHAQQLGRPLGAIPGPVTSASSVGCHRLLKEEQAQLIANSADAFALWREGAVDFEMRSGFGWDEAVENTATGAPEAAGTGDQPLELGGFPTVETPRLSAAATRVRDALRPRKRQRVGEIARECGMSEAEVRAGLSELQLLGLAADDASGWRKA